MLHSYWEVLAVKWLVCVLFWHCIWIKTSLYRGISKKWRNNFSVPTPPPPGIDTPPPPLFSSFLFFFFFSFSLLFFFFLLLSPISSNPHNPSLLPVLRIAGTILFPSFCAACIWDDDHCFYYFKQYLRFLMFIESDILTSWHLERFIESDF